MPSFEHQRLVVLLTQYPRLLVELVQSCPGIDVPGELELLPGPEKVTRPTSDRVADGAVVVRRGRGDAYDEALVLEVQLGCDEQKRTAWPVYVVGTAERLRCPTTLVVVTPSETVARWAAKPIDVGRGRMKLEPLVIGPRQIPAVMSLEEARTRPDRLALSVIVHGGRRGSLRLNRTAMQVAREMVASGDARSIVLADLIVASVRADVRRAVQREMDAETGWGKTMWFGEIGKAVAKGWAKGLAKGLAKGKIEGQKKGLAKGQKKGLAEGQKKGLAEGKIEGQKKGLAKGKAEGRKKGKAEGLAAALWLVLRTRRLEPTAQQRARVEACHDRRQLERWLRKALRADDVRDVFGRPPAR